MLKKLTICLTGIACFGLMLPVATLAEGSWIINRSHTVVTVTKEGDVNVSETVTVNFGESHKTGISRQIPLKYSLGDSVWFAKVAEIKVRRNQVDEVFTTDGDDSQLVIEVGDPRLDLSGEQIYSFEYMVKGAMRHNGKVDQLYWNATGGWETTVEQATAAIALPAEGLSGQRCEIRSDDQDAENCQSVGLKQTEGRYAAMDSLRPNASMYVMAEFAKDLVPIETVRPPSLMDWIEVYRQPLLILGSISTICLVVAGALWLKARRVRRLEQGQAGE